MKSLTRIAPAKLNLSLRILRRRPDGYHDLVTLFHRISLADQLKLMPLKTGFKLRCSNPRLPLGEDNLITKAYRLLQKKYPNLGGVSVYLKKNIPLGAGLGGGSSNAATFLLGMKTLYRLRISKKELLRLGAQLGADVPFFIHQMKQGIGIGRGDRLKNSPTRAKHIFLLAASDEELSTKDVYENLKGKLARASLTKVSREITMLCAFLEKKKYDRIDSLLQNDLEKSAFELRPSLQKVLDRFRQRGIQVVRMTGSGPTVFGVLSHLQEAKRKQKELQQDFPHHKMLVCCSF